MLLGFSIDGDDMRYRLMESCLCVFFVGVLEFLISNLYEYIVHIFLCLFSCRFTKGTRLFLFTFFSDWLVNPISLMV